MNMLKDLKEGRRGKPYHRWVPDTPSHRMQPDTPTQADQTKVLRNVDELLQTVHFENF